MYFPFLFLSFLFLSFLVSFEWVTRVRIEGKVYLVPVVGPGSELHVTVLVVKGEPSDVYLACALEDARRNVQATAVMLDHHVCVVCPVETLNRANVLQ